MIVHHAPEDYRCPFCRLAQGQPDDAVLSTPDHIVYRDDLVYAIIASHQSPINAGNTLIIPTAHYENLYELPAAIGARIHLVAQAVALAMKAAWSCDGVSTRQHNEPAGNQDVWHYHLHVTPRYTGDDFYATYLQRRLLMPAEQRAKIAAQLREVIVKPLSD